MLGLGETDGEADGALKDLRAAGVSFLTLGQYLAPTRSSWPVARFIEPEAFDAWARRAKELGFGRVESGPLVRSSYRAAGIFGGG
jgi:lipoic acid synthetase